MLTKRWAYLRREGGGEAEKYGTGGEGIGGEIRY